MIYGISESKKDLNGWAEPILRPFELMLSYPIIQ